MRHLYLVSILSLTLSLFTGINPQSAIAETVTQSTPIIARPLYLSDIRVPDIEEYEKISDGYLTQFYSPSGGGYIYRKYSDRDPTLWRNSYRSIHSTTSEVFVPSYLPEVGHQLTMEMIVDQVQFFLSDNVTFLIEKASQGTYVDENGVIHDGDSTLMQKVLFVKGTKCTADQLEIFLSSSGSIRLVKIFANCGLVNGKQYYISFSTNNYDSSMLFEAKYLFGEGDSLYGEGSSKNYSANPKLLIQSTSSRSDTVEILVAGGHSIKNKN